MPKKNTFRKIKKRLNKQKTLKKIRNKYKKRGGKRVAIKDYFDNASVSIPVFNKKNIKIIDPDENNKNQPYENNNSPTLTSSSSNKLWNKRKNNTNQTMENIVSEIQNSSN
jgi:hypothetical protein